MRLSRERRSVRDVDQQGVALATATAQRGGTETSAAPAQFVHQVHGQPRTGGADRVAERDRTAVGVHDLRVETELLARPERPEERRLVDLDEVECAGVESRVR